MTRYTGVARIFDWWGGRHQSFSKRGLFMGQRYPKMEDQKSGIGLTCNLDFAKGKGLEPKVNKFPKWSKLGDVVSKLNPNISRTVVWGPAAWRFL